MDAEKIQIIKKAERKRNAKILKILIPVTLLVIVLTVVAVIVANKAGNKAAVSGEKFESVTSNIGEGVENITDELGEDDMFKSAYAVILGEKDFVYFLEFSKKADAKSYFAGVARSFKTAVKESGNDNSQQKDYENYSYYIANADGKYLHIVRVNNTVLYAEVSEKYEKSVEDIVRLIKY